MPTTSLSFPTAVDFGAGALTRLPDHVRRLGSRAFIVTDPGMTALPIYEALTRTLDDAGVPWANVVDVLVFLTDMKNDFKTYNKVYAEYFAGEGNPNPARTTIEINALPTPIAVEIKVVAVVD